MTEYSRPHQLQVLQYRRGRMGVNAVPGSGKTWTLSRLAANLIAAQVLGDDQEALVVTLTNSAVENFASRIDGFLRGQPAGGYLLPSYRVRTLHGLAHDIVRERPALVGLADNFQIIDERLAEEIRSDVAGAWLRSHPFGLDGYLDPDLEDGRREFVRRDQLPQLLGELAEAVIRSAKDMRLTPERLRQRLDQLPVSLPLAELGASLYTDYQRALAYRGAVDFDDLIRLALEALEGEPDFLARLQRRWPYILEDEAQDSSQLQEQILRLLAGPDGNWVRVGDPNQAIFETFTTANPRYLREFLADPFVEVRELPNSGRSTASIIRLANYLIAWTQAEHPLAEARDALAPPWIEPTPPGDPQPNPPDQPAEVRLVTRKYTPEEEVQAIVDSLERWLPANPGQTVAVLAPRNERAFKLVEELNRRRIEYHDGLLRSTTPTRKTAGALSHVLRYLADPQSPPKLAKVYQVWRREDLEDEQAQSAVNQGVEWLRKCRQVEDYLWPGYAGDWLDQLPADPQSQADLAAFRPVVQRWQQAIRLPVDQLVLTLAQDLFSDPAELALAHKLAVLLRRAADGHPQWRLPELHAELTVIARNERRFLGFDKDETGFDPDRYTGIVVVATMHKAKGLEWDRVYLMSVNNYDFPSGMGYDRYIAEKWYLRQGLNLEAEARAQLQAALSGDPYAWYAEGAATWQARLDYVRERLRLLYVGITRARRELVATYNTGRRGDAQPALALVALQSFWEQTLDGLAG
jgi:DNA helicase-2/ATP-dependent DNA helicase PcrA